MLAIFGKSIASPPAELGLPLEGRRNLKTGEEIVEIFRSWKSDPVVYDLSNGSFMALSTQDQIASHPRSIVVMDDIFCIFIGALRNTSDLRRHYGLSRQATEPMIVIEAYKVLRDRAPYPADQVVKELEGNFAFLLFDAKAAKLLLARDRDGCVQLHWGVAGDGALVCSDEPKMITEACGDFYTPFPPGCIFMSENGLVSFDHPLHKVRAIVRKDDDEKLRGVIFQVDMYTRLQSIPRRGSAADWSGATVVEGE